VADEQQMVARWRLTPWSQGIGTPLS
jgi:hypothetical protein